MKKSLLIFTVTFIFLPALFLKAQEEPARPVALAPGQGGSGVDIPFEFTVSPGKWSQAERGKIFTTGYHPPDFVLPSLKEAPAPIRYPRWAVREGWEGNFSLAVEILTSGEVGRWKVIESTGYPLLDEVATKAVTTWTFHPATEKGKAVISCIQIPIRFELKD